MLDKTTYQINTKLKSYMSAYLDFNSFVENLGSDEVIDLDTIPSLKTLYELKNEPEEIQYHCFMTYPSLRRYIEFVSEEFQLKAIDISPYDGYNCSKNPSLKVKKYVLGISPDIYFYIKEPCEELNMLAIKMYPKLYRYIKNPSPKVLEYINTMKVFE